MDEKKWNETERAKAERVCAAFEDIIDRDGGANEDFEEDTRTSEDADAILEEVIRLNEAGKWQEAHARFFTAHLPFVPHMDKTEQGLTAAIILGADSFLVRRGEWHEDGPVLHIGDDTVTKLDGVLGFAISRDRKHLALATSEGVIVSDGFKGKRTSTIAWPADGVAIRPHSFAIANDGTTVVIANDDVGVLVARAGKWEKLVADVDEKEDEEEEARDVVHAAISPDGRFVAWGWEDAAGHYVERVDGEKIERVGVVGTISDRPYNVLFTDDSKRVLANARHLQGGVTVCPTIESLKGTEEYDDLPDGTPHTDEYLRAYGMGLLPGDIVWIGGAGWTHAAPLRGGKPAFTHLFGSSMNAFDYDPVAKRAIVASASGVLHVVDPATRAEPGRARGYKPRKELYRWIFWDTLKAPIRW
jgi:hypothetical protein